MRLPVSIPLIIRNVKIVGPKGKVFVDLIFDTGAAFTVLSWSVLKVIGYDPATVSARQEIITANGVIEVPKLQIVSITVGNAEAQNLEVLCHDIPELVAIRGLLGLSFIKHFKTVIDFKQGYLEIS